MLNFREYLTEEKLPTNLKPSLFLGEKEVWESLDQYKNDLHQGIDNLKNESITKEHKQVLHNLVNNPDGNCLKGTTFKKVSDMGIQFAKKINKDFGEAIGPIKIITDPSYMSWINSYKKIYVPKKSNEPFLDYTITDKDNIEHKISAKSAKASGNTVKTPNILATIENALKKKSSKYIIDRLFVNEESKYNKEYELLIKIFDIVEKEKAPSGYVKVAAELDNAYGDKKYYNTIKNLDEKFFTNLPTDRKTDFSQIKTPSGKSAKDFMSEADKIMKRYSSPPYPINAALKLLINIVFKDEIYFAKFGLNSDGSTLWELRGRRTNYSNLYVKNKSGTSLYTKLHLDAKGARGDEKLGLRIEETEFSEKNLLNESKNKTSIELLGWPRANEFTGLKMKYADKIKIANENAKQIGVGSTRVAFEIDFKNKPTVMKIAKNEKGLRQNLAEANLYKKYKNNPPYAPPMIDWDDNDDADTSWIHIMKAAKYEESAFFRHFDTSFTVFSRVLSKYINKQETNEMNDKIKKFIEFVEDNDLMLGEYRQKTNWGIYNSKPVILDAGVTKTNQELTL